MTNNRSYQGVLVITSLFLLSCGSIQVSEYNSTSKPPAGIVYYLPSSEFDISIKWELVACPNDASNPDFEVKVTTEVQTMIVRDTRHTYVIGYDDLSKMSKTGKLEIELSEKGILQSINVKAEDHSGEIIQNTVSGVGKIIRAVAGIPTIEVVGVAPVGPACRKSVRGALVAVRTLKGNIEKKRKQIDQANKLVEEWKKKKDSNEKKKKLAQLDKDIKKAVDAIAALQKKGRADYALITYTKTIRIVPMAGGNIEEPVELPVATLVRWFDKSANTEISKIPELDVYVMLERPKTNGAGSTKLFKDKAGKTIDIKAFVYRQPVSAALMICKGGPCIDKDDYVPFADRVYSANVAVPQYGHVATLPYENKMFGKNSMNVEFYANGGIKKFTHEEEKSVGAGAAKAFADTADEVYEFESQRLAAKSEKKQEKASAKTSQLTQQKEELTAEKDVLGLELEVEKARDALDIYTSSD